MKKLYIFLYVAVVVLFAVMINNTAQSETNPSNPLVGTWKSLGPVDSTGKEIDFYKGQAAYETILKDGTFFVIGFRKDFPGADKRPLTLEDFQKISKNSWGRIGTYTLDLEKMIIHAKYSHDLRPHRAHHEFTANFKVVADTAYYWIGNSKQIYRWLRVE